MPHTAKIAVIAGTGALPRLLAECCQLEQRPYVIVRFRGITLDWVQNHPVIDAEFEQLQPMFQALRQTGCTAAVFAGHIARPRLDLSRLDAKAGQLLTALAAGDDTTLGIAAQMFEDEGLKITAAHDILPDVLAAAGPLGRVLPSPADMADIRRAAEIVTALGKVDVGQGTVVAGGLCLGLETLQGTDAMLKFVAGTQGIKAGPAQSGVLFKAPKPDQDWRFDLPAIGPATVKYAAAAGLNGIALAAGGVMILERDKTRALADELGLFVFGHRV